MNAHTDPTFTALPDQMTALVRRRFGGPEVIETAQIRRPEPKPGEILIHVHSSAVTTGDWRLRAAAFPGILAPVGWAMFGFRKPRDPQIGSSFAGVVAGLGAGVTGFEIGQRVFGMGSRSHAEFMVIKADGAVAALPDSIPFAEAAALPFAAVCALVFLRDIAKLQAGEHVLILGGSGAIGSMAIQMAKQMGATVTAMASAANLDRVRSLGADHAVDYRVTAPHQIPGRFDVILDPVSALTPGQAKGLLAPKGRFVPLEFSLTEMLAALFWPLTSTKRTRLAVSGDRAEDLREIADWVAAGPLKPTLDQILPFGQARRAHERVQSRHAQGTVVLEGW